MSLPFGVDWNVLIGGMIGGIIGAIILIGSTLIEGRLKRASWTGSINQWKGGIDDWKNSIDNRFDKFAGDIIKLREHVSAINASLWDPVTPNGMVRRRSPLVPSKQAIEILEELNIISEVNANTSYIQEEIEKRAQTSLYRDIEDQEERFIEIAPGVIHSFIKKGVLHKIVWVSLITPLII